MTIAAFLLAACTLPEPLPAPPLAASTPTPAAQPAHCLGDGIAQTWQLLPLDPAQSELLAAYESGQIIEFQAVVAGSNEDPADLPYRGVVLSEAAEAITITLDYLGDPPPLMFGQSLRFVAWADFGQLPNPVSQPEEDEPGPNRPMGQSYALEVFDAAGLLFLGATDADLHEDPLGITFENVEGDCPAVPVPGNACVAERQVQPLRIVWDDQELVLFPGENGQIVHDNALYEVSLFRNRLVRPADPPCPGYYEHRRSVRLERLEPLPFPPILPEVTITATSPITARLIITPSEP